MSTADHRIFLELVRRFGESTGLSREERWKYLEAAHIVGQQDMRLHWRSHALMLQLARREGDWPEAAGQAFRMLLVPLGHLAGRLPVGNTGRSTVSAFQPMAVDQATQALISSTSARLQARGDPS